VTYAGAHGRDEVGPVNWILHREWVLAREVHPLSVRRAETTRIAIEDLDAPSSHLRWALGVAAGALLVAGTVVAGSLGGTSEDANSAGSIPEHTLASLEQRLSVTEHSADAPVSAPAPVNEQPQQQTAPASTEPRVDAVVAQDHATGGGETQRTAPSANTPAPAPALAPAPVQQWGYGAQQWSPSGFGAPTPSSYSAATSTPTGPAMSMLDPFCNTMGS
jgi:hypothetical protein